VLASHLQHPSRNALAEKRPFSISSSSSARSLLFQGYSATLPATNVRQSA
jgi:hypothetical protein